MRKIQGCPLIVPEVPQISLSLSCGQKGENSILDFSVTHLGPIWTEDRGTQLEVLMEIISYHWNCMSPTDLHCPQDKRPHCLHPQLLYLLLWDPKLSMKKTPKIFCQGSDGCIFTPYQANENLIISWNRLSCFQLGFCLHMANACQHSW